MQCYLPQDRELALLLLQRAVAAGADAVVLTVDTRVVGTEQGSAPGVWGVVDPATIRVNFDPGYDDSPDSAKARDLSTADIAWLGERVGLPVVVKGVLRPDGAVRCRGAGAAAVWVSNHGGRQLERAVSTAEALPLVRAALGPDAAFVGRLASWSLVDGEAGVARMHAELRVEMTELSRLTGCARMSECRGVAALDGLTTP